MNYNKEQIELLKEFQEVNKHPYTCDGYSDNCFRRKAYSDRLEGKTADFNDKNEGVLIVTSNGFICPCGDYKQNL